VKRPRRGYSLVEMSVVISMTAVVISTSAVALATMFRIDRQMRQELLASDNLMRLSKQLRADAHQAQTAAIETEEGDEQNAAADRLLLTVGDDRSISYQTVAGRVERLVRRGETVEHRESYRLAENASLVWVVAAEEPLSRVRLEVHYDSNYQPQPYRPVSLISVDAAVGLDHAHATRKEP
jgi:type II secretory pathway component PulJ